MYSEAQLNVDSNEAAAEEELEESLGGPITAFVSWQDLQESFPVTPHPLCPSSSPSPSLCAPPFPTSADFIYTSPPSVVSFLPRTPPDPFELFTVAHEHFFLRSPSLLLNFSTSLNPAQPYSISPH